MNLLREYFSNNRRIFLYVLLCWVAGSVCGAFCGACGSKADLNIVEEYVSSSVAGKLSFQTIVKNGLITNLGFTAIVLMFSSVFVFIPLTFVLIAFKGFAYSLTTTLFIRFFSFRGVLLSFTNVVIPLCISVGVYFAMFVCAIRYPLDLQRAIRHPGKHQKPQWTTHAVKMGVLCAALCATTFFEAFLSKLIPYII